MPTISMTRQLTVPNADQASLAQMERQRRIADMLQSQAFQPTDLPGPTNAGGYVPRTSPLVGLSKLAQAWMGKRKHDKIDSSEREIVANALQRRNQALAGAMTGFDDDGAPTAGAAAVPPQAAQPAPAMPMTAQPQPATGDPASQLSPADGHIPPPPGQDEFGNNLLSNAQTKPFNLGGPQGMPLEPARGTGGSSLGYGTPQVGQPPAGAGGGFPGQAMPRPDNPNRSDNLFPPVVDRGTLPGSIGKPPLEDVFPVGVTAKREAPGAAGPGPGFMPAQEAKATPARRRHAWEYLQHVLAQAQQYGADPVEILNNPAVQARYQHMLAMEKPEKLGEGDVLTNQFGDPLAKGGQKLSDAARTARDMMALPADNPARMGWQQDMASKGMHITQDGMGGNWIINAATGQAKAVEGGMPGKFQTVESGAGMGPNGQPLTTTMQVTPQGAKPIPGVSPRSSGQQINVGVNTQKNLLGTVAEKVGGDIGNLPGQARSAVASITSVHQIRSALDSGGVMAGPVTGKQVWLNQLATKLGFPSDQEGLNQTRKVIQGAAELALQSRGMLKGQGQITENEQRLLDRARSVDVESMSVGEIRQVLDVIERAQRNIIEQSREWGATYAKDPAAQSLAPAFMIEMPPVYGSKGGFSAADEARLQELERKHGTK
jgi:hypothetical protein